MSRTAAHPVDPLFVERWSPRAFDGSAMPPGDVSTLFEAARWAPSAYNLQPWRFLYAARDTADFARFLALLVPGNAVWAQHAGLLIFALSDTLAATSPDRAPKPSHSHSFDCGSAWVQLALQATRLGYQAHAMVGIDFERTRTELTIPDRFRIEAGIAIGRQGDPAALPEQMRSREFPSNRRPIAKTAFAGNFVV